MEHRTRNAEKRVCRGQRVFGAGFESGTGGVAEKGDGAIKSRRWAGLPEWRLSEAIDCRSINRIGGNANSLRLGFGELKV